MKNVIRYDNVDFFAYSNDKHIKGDISGIVVFYRGLGSTAMISDDTTVEALKPTVERAMRSRGIDNYDVIVFYHRNRLPCRIVGQAKKSNICTVEGFFSCCGIFSFLF